jgi:hypothetical protein
MRDTTSRDEQGSALVMALVMLSVVGLMVGAALTYAGASLRTTNTAYRPNRGSLYAADSAIQGAIQYVRNNPEMATDVLGAQCITDAYKYTDPTVGLVSVDACPQSDSLIYEGRFRAVLLSLGTTSTDGIVLSHNGDVNIGGHVWSNSKIDLSNPTHMVVNGGRVWAWGACNRIGNIEMDPGVSPVCNASTTFGGVKPKVALDPDDPSLGHVADWQPAAAPATLVQPAIPACVSNAMTLQPGVYYSGSEFSSKTNGCTNVTLSPGVYYLDFPAGDDLWSLDTDFTATCDGTGQGAQLVFADSAHILLSGTLTIPCGRKATTDGPLIAMFGLKNGVAATGPFTTTLRPSATPTETQGTYWNAASLANVLPGAASTYPQDATNATATINGNKTTSELTIGSFAATAGPALSTKATVSSVVVKVAHDETAGVGFQTATALKWGSCPAVPLTPSTSSTATVYTSANLAAQLTNCGFDQTPQVVWNLKRSGNGSPDTLQVDGAQIEVTWTNPGIPAQSGCVVKAPGASGFCPLITPPSNGKGRMVIQAVVYIPSNTMQGKFNNTGNFKIGTALIARTLDVDINPNLDGSPVIGEDAVRHTNGDVVFTARIGGQPWTSSQVTFPALASNGIGSPLIQSWVIKK